MLRELELESADIGSLVQLIVDKPGWASGNAMVFKIHEISGPGFRPADSFEGGGPPKLKITVM